MKSMKRIVDFYKKNTVLFLIIFFLASFAMVAIVKYCLGMDFVYQEKGNIGMEEHVICDFFYNTNAVNGRTPYPDRALNYPPFAHFIFYLIDKFFIQSKNLGTIVQDNFYGFHTSLLFILFSMLFLLINIYTYVYMEAKEGDKKESSIEFFIIILSVIFCFTAPILYCYQQGNITIITVCFCLLFLSLYKSKNRFLSEIGVISLAVASNIKLYPAIFSLFLLKQYLDKDISLNKILRFCLYSIVLFFLPLFIFKGNIITNLESCIKSIIAFGNRDYRFWKFGMGNFTYPIARLLNIKKDLKTFNFVLFFIFTLLNSIAFFVTNNRTYQMILSTFSMLLIPHYNLYALSFLIIPIIFLITLKNKNNFEYIVLFVLCFIMSPILSVEMEYSSFIIMMILVLINIYVLVASFKDLVKR